MPPGMPAAGPLVLLPTYNERRSLPDVVRGVRAALPGVAILVVDDASPDGTGAWVRDAARSDPDLHLLARPRKAGIGSAWQDGWRWALARGHDPVVTMDADLSHDPAALPALLAALARGADVVVGSRYVPGGRVEAWGLHRRLLSGGANLAARLLLGMPVRDATSGYRACSARALQALEGADLRTEGYSFLEESLWRLHRAGFRVREVPICFRGRRHDRSKIDRREVLRAAGTLLRLAGERLRRPAPSRPAAP